MYCSEGCREEYLRRNNAGWARRAVFKRDKGVCARCGLDTEAFSRAVRAWRWAWEESELKRARHLPPPPSDVLLVRLWEHFSRQRYVPRRGWRNVFAVYGFPDHYAAAWWEADHILSVVEGGGECDLDNLQTLCRHCHRLATRELHVRRKLARRAAAGQPALDLEVPA